MVPFGIRELVKFFVVGSSKKLVENPGLSNFIDAEAEGFAELAASFRAVAKIEAAHEKRYRTLLNNIEMKAVFEKSGETMWECRNCGHIVVGKEAPEVCPVCNHPQSYFEIHAENY